MGIFPDLSYPEVTAKLEPGDLLAIYSDGVTEACSPDGHDYDVAQLGPTLIANRHRSAKEIVDAVADRVREWTHNAPPADDITVVVARRV
jgi:serine phosphatase RsbU (regulator of sigma subunit)